MERLQRIVWHIAALRRGVHGGLAALLHGSFNQAELVFEQEGSDRFALGTSANDLLHHIIFSYMCTCIWKYDFDNYTALEQR
jgi:hypothetical protein